MVNSELVTEKSAEKWDVWDTQKVSHCLMYSKVWRLET